MLFNIDEDARVRIVGWLLPDNPSVEPRFRVVLEDRPALTLPANQFRSSLKDQGLHHTGMCGFLFDESNCPGLEAAETVSIFDEETSVLIFRRKPPPTIEAKLLRIDPSLLWHTPLDDVLSPVFQMAFEGLGSLPTETVGNILRFNFSPSVYASGRVLIRAYEHIYRERGYKTCILVRDPHHEIAERLLVLKWAAGPEGTKSISRLGADVYPAAKLLRDVSLESIQQVEALMGRLSETTAPMFFNPLTRCLASTTAHEPLDSLSVSLALETLSDIDVVGLASDIPSFLEGLSAKLGPRLPMPRIGSKDSLRVEALAEVLRTSDAITETILMDLEIYHAIGAALETVAERSGE